MKYVLFLMLLHGYAFGQIPPKANTIIVKGLSFNEVCERLLDSGYVIEKKDNDLKTVSTSHKIYPRFWNAAYKIHVRVKDSIAYFSGTYTAPYEQPFTRAANKTDPLFNGSPIWHHTNRKGETHPKSLAGYPFILLNRFVLGFGKPVEYKIQ